ncbi:MULTISPECIES: acyl carrier protein [unclassified Streptomyces]|uniref:acyl carrier protein n=1 Tax=unclassified Streptomyces TaxID=2593676 RepID=UPI0036487A6C
MAELTIDQLKDFLHKAIGEDESVDLDGDVLDTSFADLGFDSLAVIDTTSKVERHFSIKLPENEAGEARTPRALLDLVNRELEAPAARP